MMPYSKPIVIIRGDDTDAFGLRTITIKLVGDLDLTNARAKFALLNYTKEWSNEDVRTGELTFAIPSVDTKQMPLGDAFGKLWLYEIGVGDGSDDKRLTVCNTIPFFVTNKVCGLQDETFDINVTLSVDTEINIEFKASGGGEWVKYPNGEALMPKDNNIQRIIIPALADVALIPDRYTLADVKAKVNAILSALKI